MASITLSIDGDPSGAVAAARDVTSAVGQMEAKVSAGATALASYESKSAAAMQTSAGFQGRISSVISMANDFSTVLARASGDADSMQSKAAEVVGAIGRITMAAGSMPGPAGIISGLLQTAIEIVPALGPAKKEMTAVQVAAAETKAQTELYAKDAAMVFTGVVGQAGVSRDATYTSIDALIRLSQKAGDSSEDSAAARAAAATMAGQLFETIEASDRAATKASITADSYDLLQASQKAFLADVPAAIGGMSTVIDMASHAGVSVQQMSALIGTQTVSDSPAWTPAFESHDYVGPAAAGRPYLVGTGAQPELFVPSESGHMYPAGSYPTGREAGAVTNIINVTVQGMEGLRGIGSRYGIPDFERRVKQLMREGAQSQSWVRGYLQET